jgi:hypothetical protein
VPIINPSGSSAQALVPVELHVSVVSCGGGDNEGWHRLLKLQQLAAVKLIDVDEILLRIGRIRLNEVGGV